MMNIQYRNAEDTDVLAGIAGTVLDGEPIVQLGLIKNIGDEVIQKMYAWVENDLSKPLTCEASSGSVTFPDLQNVPVGAVPSGSVLLTPGAGLPAGGLAPGASIPLRVTWAGAAGLTMTDLDVCRIKVGV